MRGKAAVKQKLKPDTRYNNILVTKFINYIMRDGKRSVAEEIVYNCFDEIEKQIKAGKIDAKTYPNAFSVFDQAIKNVMPQMEVRGKRVGGGNYQVPFPVRGERRYFLSYHWIIDTAKKKKGRPMHLKLTDELVAALKNEGDAIRKKNDVHRMAEANRAFAHFARY